MQSKEVKKRMMLRRLSRRIPKWKRVHLKEMEAQLMSYLVSRRLCTTPEQLKFNEAKRREIKRDIEALLHRGVKMAAYVLPQRYH